MDDTALISPVQPSSGDSSPGLAALLPLRRSRTLAVLRMAFGNGAAESLTSSLVY
jgi:hypothetical protein